LDEDILEEMVFWYCATSSTFLAVGIPIASFGIIKGTGYETCGALIFGPLGLVLLLE